MVFRQKRYGLDGRDIIVYKFRTMRVTEDGNPVHQGLAPGPRESPRSAPSAPHLAGRLPQLFNVLEGTMSLVGPRPHVVAMNERYRRLIPSYMLRHKIKPGMGGPRSTAIAAVTIWKACASASSSTCTTCATGRWDWTC